MRKIGGNGPYRHVYPGQEANLYTQLMKTGITIEKFNEYWDRIEQQNHDHQLSEDEKNAEYRQEIVRRTMDLLRKATTQATQKHWKPYTDQELLKIYRLRNQSSGR